MTIDRDQPLADHESATPEHDVVQFAGSRTGGPVTADPAAGDAPHAATPGRRRLLAAVVGVVLLVAGAVVVITVSGDDPPDSIAVTADDDLTEDGNEQEPAAEEPGEPAPSDDPSGEASAGPAPDGDDAAEDDAAQDDAAHDDAAHDDAAQDDAAQDDAAADAAPVEVPSTAIDAAPAVVSPEVVAASRSTVAAASSTPNTSTELFAWGDGFLAIDRTWEPQAFPTEIPDDVRALFSDEVVTLIEDAAPTTIDEATSLLSEAGLLDEVTSVLSEHPEASAAIYGAGSGVTTTARTSPNGIDWESIGPVGPVPVTDADVQWYSDGRRLAGLVLDHRDVESSHGATAGWFAGNSEVVGARLVWSDDLLDWKEVEVPVPSRDPDLPDVVLHQVWADGIAMSGDRWVVSLQSYTDFDYDEIFAGHLDGLDNGNGFGTGSNDAGVELEVYASDGSTTQLLATWEELGVDPALADRLTRERGGGQLVAGSFDGSDVVSVPLVDHGQLIATAAGFHRIGESVTFSTDGVTWSTVPWPSDEAYPVMPMQVAGSLLVFLADPSSDADMRAVGFDAAALDWIEASVPSLPAGSYDAYGAPTSTAASAVLHAMDTPWVAAPFETNATAEIDGYVLDVTLTHLGESYTLTGPDGVEIVTESYDQTVAVPRGDGPYEFRTFDGERQQFLDPATGEVLLEVDWSDLDELYQALQPPPDVYPDEPAQPETRLLATDGVDWIDEIVIPGAEGDASPLADGRWPSGVTSNGDVALIAWGDGSIERFEF